jgi:hypothetical protein
MAGRQVSDGGYSDQDSFNLFKNTRLGVGVRKSCKGK